jgi:hypothetical protein
VKKKVAYILLFVLAFSLVPITYAEDMTPYQDLYLKLKEISNDFQYDYLVSRAYNYPAQNDYYSIYIFQNKNDISYLRYAAVLPDQLKRKGVITSIEKTVNFKSYRFRFENNVLVKDYESNQTTSIDSGTGNSFGPVLWISFDLQVTPKYLQYGNNTIMRVLASGDGPPKNTGIGELGARVEFYPDPNQIWNKKQNLLIKIHNALGLVLYLNNKQLGKPYSPVQDKANPNFEHWDPMYIPKELYELEYGENIFKFKLYVPKDGKLDENYFDEIYFYVNYNPYGSGGIGDPSNPNTPPDGSTWDQFPKQPEKPDNAWDLIGWVRYLVDWLIYIVKTIVYVLKNLGSSVEQVFNATVDIASFFKKIFGFLPTEITTLFGIGITALIIRGLVRK